MKTEWASLLVSVRTREFREGIAREDIVPLSFPGAWGVVNCGPVERSDSGDDSRSTRNNEGGSKCKVCEAGESIYHMLGYGRQRNQLLPDLPGPIAVLLSLYQTSHLFFGFICSMTARSFVSC